MIAKFNHMKDHKIRRHRQHNIICDLMADFYVGEVCLCFHLSAVFILLLHSH